MLKTSWSAILTLLFCIMSLHKSLADIDSGCPSWGCLPWGSFSLSAGIPSLNSTIPWRVDIEEVSVNNSQSIVPRGCVSDQQSVVCTTQTGYVSIDPTNGKQLWNYTTMASPYLPIMDIYGDVIGMDVKAMYYIGADGKPKQPIRVGIIKPQYSLMVGNDSIMMLTGSTNRTAQVFTYLTDGIIDGSLPLRDAVEQNNGTFIPFSHPIIAGFRVYIMTYFLPDNMETKEAQRISGILRLYAIDILHQLAPTIKIAWYFNFGKWTTGQTPQSFGDHDSSTSNGLEPIVTYFDGKVYVNVPEGLEYMGKNKVKQPWPASLWAIRDDGDGGSLVFKTSCIYGPMAVFDTYDKPLSKPKRCNTKRDDGNHVVWIANHSPAMLLAHDTSNGTIVHVNGLDTIFQKLEGWISSSLSITRTNCNPNDQLVFGMSDSSGQARIVVIEVDNGQAKLLLSHVVSKPTQDKNSMAYVEGQIVNFAFHPPTRGDNNNKDEWTFGLSAVVNQSNGTVVSRSVVGVF